MQSRSYTEGGEPLLFFLSMWLLGVPLEQMQNKHGCQRESSLLFRKTNFTSQVPGTPEASVVFEFGEGPILALH